MKKCKGMLLVLAGMGMPALALAQDGSLADSVKGLHGVLDQLYAEMLPKCEQLIGVGRGLAGFATLWYIAARVWGHLARTEPIDFYPLFKPFVIGFAILFFPLTIALINGLMKPTVAGTAQMVDNSDAAVAALLRQKDSLIKTTDFWQMYVGETGSGDRDKWYKYTHPGKEPSDEGWLAGIGNDIKFALAKASYNFRNAIKEVIAEILQLLFAAVSLCINTLRTFNLIILAMLGPLAFGLSVFDGFGHTLKHWLARYINVFLWLPICNIFGSVIGTIQENMLRIDLGQIQQAGDTFFSRTDMAYLVFLLIGIFGYTTVPNIANHIVWVGGGDALTGKVTGGMIAAGTAAAGMAGMAGRQAVKEGQQTLQQAGSVAGGLMQQTFGGYAGQVKQGYQEGYNSPGTGQGWAARLGARYGKVSSAVGNAWNKIRKISGD